MVAGGKSKTPKKWAAPAAPERGDDDERGIYAAVGAALTKWEQLEHELGQIFVALIGYGRSVEAQRAYGAIMANSGRLDMINAALESFFLTRQSDDHKVIRANLIKILADVRDLSARRNEIAHGIVGIKLGDDIDEFTDASFVLAPSFFTYKKRKLFVVTESSIVGMSPDYEYSSAQINTIATWFVSLRQRATKIALAIRRLRYLEQQALLQKSS
jgi:hypothetical protein